MKPAQGTSAHNVNPSPSISESQIPFSRPITDAEQRTSAPYAMPRYREMSFSNTEQRSSAPYAMPGYHELAVNSKDAPLAEALAVTVTIPQAVQPVSHAQAPLLDAEQSTLTVLPASGHPAAAPVAAGAGPEELGRVMTYLSLPAPHRPLWQKIVLPGLGIVFLAIGVAGIILPLVPGFPFLILAPPLLCTVSQSLEDTCRKSMFRLAMRYKARKARKKAEREARAQAKARAAAGVCSQRDPC